MMEMVLDVDAITSEIKNIRDEYTQYKQCPKILVKGGKYDE